MYYMYTVQALSDVNAGVSRLSSRRRPLFDVSVCIFLLFVSTLFEVNKIAIKNIAKVYLNKNIST